MNYRDPSARDQGLDEATISCIPSYGDADRLTDSEKSAVRFAELLALNHTAIDDETFADLRKHFSEEQIVEIGWAAGSFISFGRLIHVFGAKWEGEPQGNLKPVFG